MTLYFLKNIRQQYAARTVLDIPELVLDAGRIYTLTGPNGAGKTTLLNILSFLEAPTSGQMTFNSMSVTFNAAAMRQLRKSVILLDQHPILFSTSVYKNMELGLKFRKIPRDKREPIIRTALNMVGMEGFINADARRLSGGETRRVAIARAMACKPAVLLMDEPTADLDIENQLRIESIIRDIHRQSPVTIIFCTHNLVQGDRLTPHHIYLFAGQVRESEHENIFKGEITTKNDRQYCRITEKVLIPIPATDKRDTKISIRPDAVRVADRKNTDPESQMLSGNIIGLSSHKDRVRAIIDAGILLSLSMEKSEYDIRNLRINASVNIEIDPGGVTLF